jgi:hypothetical protein
LQPEELDASAIRGTLFAADLRSKPTYSALSYACQDAYYAPPYQQPTPTPQRWIFCNNQRLSVSNNLYEALRHLQHIRLRTPVWIDAISIDQANANEKKNQILMMGSIFSGAKDVIVWLGHPNADFDEILWVQNTLGPRMRAAERRYGSEVLWGRGPEDADLQKMLAIPDLSIRLAKFVKFHCENRWFSRVWTFQEAGLARSLKVYCGNTLLNWNLLSEFSHSFSRSPLWTDAVGRAILMGCHNEESIRNKFIFPFQREMIREVSTMTNVSNRVIRWHGDLSDSFEAGDNLQCGHAWAFMMMVMMRDLKCSNELDSIYGCLGIAGLLLEEGEHGLEFQPDYTKSANEIYTDFMRNSFEKVGSLSFLCFVNDGVKPKKRRDIPSWVIDFSELFLATQIPFTDAYKYFDASKTRFHVPAVAKWTFSFPDQHTLRLQGIKLDSVLHLCEVNTFLVLLCGKFHKFLELAVRLPKTTNAVDRQEAMCRAVLYDTLDDKHPIAEDLTRSWKAFVFGHAVDDLVQAVNRGDSNEDTEAIKSSLKRSLDALYDPMRLPTYSDVETLYVKLMEYRKYGGATEVGKQGIRELEALQEDIERLKMQKEDTISALRRTCVTRIGHVGFVPFIARRDDQVWAVKGCHVPLVLRPKGPGLCKYELLGDSYIQGYMRGETLDNDDRERGRKWEYIDIV